MGCDIHLYTEVLKTVYDKKTWVNCDRWKLNPYYGLEDEENQYEIDYLYHDRNYALFAVLADVRNYGGTPHICEPKGLPEDVSTVVKAESDRWDCDGHSHSWFTLAELIANRHLGETIKTSGYVSLTDAALIDAGASPTSWCQMTSDRSWVFREWVRKTDVLGDLIDLCIERMMKEFWIFNPKDIQVGDYEKFRIVFWFDN